MEIREWVQAKHGLNGWLECYCVDRAVGLVGNTIENALHKRHEIGGKWVSEYASIHDVFAALERGTRVNGADAFIAASKNTRGVQVIG